MKALIVVDMQNDFISSSLANPDAEMIVPDIVEKIHEWDGPIFFTADTHYEDYLSTQEGKKLPIPHCIRLTSGWQLHPDIAAAEHLYEGPTEIVLKSTFGDISELKERLIKYNVDEIYLCGTCTDICVVSIALNLKAAFPEIPMFVYEDLCAGTSLENHTSALHVMNSCQIEVI